MRPRTIGDLIAKRSGTRPVAPAPRVTHPWWMDPAGLRRKCAPGGREAARRSPERVPPDP
jgi:hypothetical protein